MLSPLLILDEEELSLPELDDFSEEVFIPIYSLVAIFLCVGLGLIMIIYLTGKGKEKGWYAGETDYREEPAKIKETDEVNWLMANMRKQVKPNNYELTPIFCQQFIVNHAKKEEVSHDKFPTSVHNCHMNPVQVAKFATIWNSLPSTCGAHIYVVQGGLVRYKETNEPVRANAFIIRIIEGYERSNGTWPKFDKFEDDMRKFAEEDARNGKWDYGRGLPPR